jgi:phosphoribosylaminoimidazole-succinocarboxamide synthase
MYLIAANIIGQELYDRISRIAIELYNTAASYAYARGLILADTKFEFGLISHATTPEPELILIDEVLTPDSSRYWPLDGYKPGSQL